MPLFLRNKRPQYEHKKPEREEVPEPRHAGRDRPEGGGEVESKEAGEREGAQIYREREEERGLHTTDRAPLLKEPEGESDANNTRKDDQIQRARRGAGVEEGAVLYERKSDEKEAEKVLNRLPKNRTLRISNHVLSIE